MILLGGTTNSVANYDIVLARIDPEGLPDDSFGSAGTIILPIGTGDDSCNAMMMQPDGKILLVGESYNGHDSDVLVARLTDSGQLDATFGTDGKTLIDAFGGTDAASAVLQQPDGSIVVVGAAFNGVDYDFLVVRLTSKGQPDSTFGTNGIVTMSIGEADDRAVSCVLDSTGRIIICGQAMQDGLWRFALACCTQDGELDSSFADNGIALPSLGSGDELATSVLHRVDGKLLVSGCISGSSEDFGTVTFDENGLIDSGYGSDGIATTTLTTQEGSTCSAFQVDGRLVLAGTSTGTPRGPTRSSYLGDLVAYVHFALARFMTDGSPDKDFGQDGIVITSLSSGNDYAAAICIQDDGKILVAGNTDDGSVANMAIARYWP
jgi:uncharacterized delta-60 repeat protein